MIFRACSLENEVGDPAFFYIFDITKSSSYTGESLRKKSMLGNLRANVLKLPDTNFLFDLESSTSVTYYCFDAAEKKTPPNVECYAVLQFESKV